MIKDVKWPLLKGGMEQELYFLCKNIGITEYISNDYLDQGYSLTMPYDDYENLQGFAETVSDVLERAKMQGIQNVINRAQHLLDVTEICLEEARIEYEKDNEIEGEER